jgi:signal transduction histidine kinase
MKRSPDWSYQWILFLTAGLLYGAAVLRSLFIYWDSSELSQVLGPLLAWLVLFATEAAISRRWSGYFPIYMVLETILTLLLLFTPGFPDYFAVLFGVLSMQIMQHLDPRHGAVWIGLFSPLMMLPLVKTYGASNGVAFALIYTGGDVLLASYALAIRRAQAARAQNQALAQELQEANRQLQAYSKLLEKLAVSRERQRLARELHDSATQTVFSMTLTTQSALLLLDRDPSRVGAQLDRLNQLAQSALSEMHILISELNPEKVAEGGLAAALRRHLADRHLPENLAVSLEIEGDQPLGSTEEQGLFRIAQEALNNIVKHAQASQACVRLHLAAPFWIEIEDRGQGFDLRRARESGRLGLVSMRERAAEIGWNLQIITFPGAGTRIRVERNSSGGRQA